MDQLQIEVTREQRDLNHTTTERIDQCYSLIWLDKHSNEFSVDIEYTKNILCKFNHRC